MIDDFGKKILGDWNLDAIAPVEKERSPVDHWSPAVLLERAAYLRKMARFGSGSASDIIKDFPHYSAVLQFQGRTGDAEIHENHTCFLHVLGGAATLMIGGTLTRAVQTGAGELRGDSIENGAKQDLRQGDIVHIPAGTPHQILISGEKPITCLMVKIKEVE
jgi:mannose-6-phosphate isomerase-like protein (cupin superfamily)